MCCRCFVCTTVSSHVAAPFSISTNDGESGHSSIISCLLDAMCVCPDVDGLLSKALLMGNFELAVEICLHADRMVI